LKEIRKEILVELKEEGPYTVITRIDASFVKDPITLAVRRGVERERMVLREIMEETLDNTVELFR
jgi:hypothetical protein